MVQDDGEECLYKSSVLMLFIIAVKLLHCLPELVSGSDLALQEKLNKISSSRLGNGLVSLVVVHANKYSKAVADLLTGNGFIL